MAFRTVRLPEDLPTSSGDDGPMWAAADAPYYPPPAAGPAPTMIPHTHASLSHNHSHHSSYPQHFAATSAGGDPQRQWASSPQQQPPYQQSHHHHQHQQQYYPPQHDGGYHQHNTAPVTAEATTEEDADEPCGVRPKIDALRVQLARRYGSYDERDRTMAWLRQAQRHEVSAVQAQRCRTIYERHPDTFRRGAPLVSGTTRPQHSWSHDTTVMGKQPTPLRQQIRHRDVSDAPKYDREWALGARFSIVPQRAIPDERHHTPGPGAYPLPSMFQKKVPPR